MSEPTPRQVLYALVAGGFLLVVLALVVGSAVAELAPTWWTITMSSSLGLVIFWSVANWRKTAPVLLLSIGMLVIWTVGTLIVA